jgi:hypothetical protein
VSLPAKVKKKTIREKEKEDFQKWLENWEKNIKGEKQ